MPGPEIGVWESNADLLTNDEPPHCLATGTYQIPVLLCNLYKVCKGEDTPEGLSTEAHKLEHRD